MDLMDLANKFLASNTIQEQCTDPKILALRSEMVRKVDCAITVKNTVDPILKALRLNIFIYVTAMLGYMLLGPIALFICLLGAGANLYYSKSQSDRLLEIEQKYMIK